MFKNKIVRKRGKVKLSGHSTLFFQKNCKLPQKRKNKEGSI